MNKKNNFKKLMIVLIILISNIFLWTKYTYSQEINLQKQINPSSLLEINKTETNSQKELNFEEILNFFWEYSTKEIPDSYKYISLNFRWIKKDSKLYKSLQKLVYLNKLENKNILINKNKKLSKYTFFKLSEKIFWLNFTFLDAELLKKHKTTQNELNQIKNLLQDISDIDIKNVKNLLQNEKTSLKKEISQKKEIFSDVYSILLNNHYDKKNIKEKDIMTSAIEWLAKWTKDKHTVYFPPTKSKNFYESLSGEYEWIWSYVDMEKPWFVKIVSPISWSPSQKAWLKWWDIITKVDDKEVLKENSLKEVVSWIKWPAWTKVKLTIKRLDKNLEIIVTRAKIVLKDIEYKLIGKNIFYIEMKNFWDNISIEFEKAIQDLKKQKYINRVIIDLRNNWWWYLWEVVNILWHFVKRWDPTAIIKYTDDVKKFYSLWYDLVDFSKYDIVILQNSWTASASEIMIWTIRDYYPEVKIIWEKSYWKWSVQTIKNYSDGSTIKYTIAKWFTWLTETWIDEKWIEPTIKLEFDMEKYNKSKIDNQLEKAKNILF